MRYKRNESSRRAGDKHLQTDLAPKEMKLRYCLDCGRPKRRAEFRLPGKGMRFSARCSYCRESDKPLSMLAARSSYAAWLIEVTNTVGFDRNGKVKGPVRYPNKAHIHGPLAGVLWTPADDWSATL